MSGPDEKAVFGMAADAEDVKVHAGLGVVGQLPDLFHPLPDTEATELSVLRADELADVARQGKCRGLHF